MRLCNLTAEIISDILKKVEKELLTAKDIGSTVTVNVPTTKHQRAKIIYSETAWNKQCALVKQCDKEIAWHFVVTKETEEDKAVYTIEDIIVFPQMVTGSTVTSDDTEYTMWICGLSDEVFEKTRGHGHSHVNMGVFPSSVDTDYQNMLVQNLEDFYVFVITNKKGDIWTKIVDVEDNVIYDKTDIDVVYEAPEEVWAEQQINQYVKAPTPAPVFTYADWQKQQLAEIDKKKAEEKEEDESWFTDDSFFEEWEKINADYGYQV